MGMFGSSMRAAPSDMTNAYNTHLTNDEERAYQLWRSQLPPNLQNTADYDLRGAYKANAQEAGNGHLPDTWKKPNHMTFSDGSIYASAENPAGQWAQAQDGSWTYNAPQGFTRHHSVDDLLNYFQAFEQGNRVVLPPKR